MGMFDGKAPTLAEFQGDPNGDPDLTGLDVVIPPSGRFYVEGSAVVSGGSTLSVTNDAGEPVAVTMVAPGGEWHELTTAGWVHGEPGSTVTLRMSIDGEYRPYPVGGCPRLEATTVPKLPGHGGRHLGQRPAGAGDLDQARRVMETEMDRYWDLTPEEWRELSTGVLLDLLVRVPPTSDLHSTVRGELTRRIDGDHQPAIGETTFKAYEPDGPPCPRCGKPMFKVELTGFPGVDHDSIWGHDCGPT